MSAYDVLMENLPDYFKPVLEFIQIMRAHGYALDQLDGDIQNVYNNFYIQTCDVTTLAYYEGLLDIIPSAGDTVEYRRQRVMQQLSLIPKFDINWLRDKLTELYGKDGYDLTVSSVNSTLSVNITSGMPNAVRLFYDFIWDVIPAHIALSAQQNVNTTIPVSIYTGACIASTSMSVIPSS